MKSLYRTATPVTAEEFRKMSVATGSKSALISIILVLEAVMAGLLAAGIRSNDLNRIEMAVILLILLPLVAYFVPRFMLRRSYATNESANNVVLTIWFYKNFFKVHSRSATSVVRYGDLQRIVETKDHFYLMLDRNRVVIVIKANCEPGLITMLQKIHADLADGKLKTSAELGAVDEEAEEAEDDGHSAP
jgi:hypothetical protein